MKHIFTLLLISICTLGSVNAQLGIQLRAGYNDDLCPGYDDEANTVYIDVVNMPPLTPAPNTNVEYYWVINHENGDWAYQTDNAARGFKVPFEGEYRMRCQVLYVDLHTTYAYASFWSSPLIVQTGESCE